MCVRGTCLSRGDCGCFCLFLFILQNDEMCEGGEQP